MGSFREWVSASWLAGIPLEDHAYNIEPPLSPAKLAYAQGLYQRLDDQAVVAEEKYLLLNKDFRDDLR